MEKFPIMKRSCRRLYLISAVIGVGLIIILYLESENISHLNEHIYEQDQNSVPIIDRQVSEVRNDISETYANSKTLLDYREKQQVPTSDTGRYGTSRNTISYSSETAQALVFDTKNQVPKASENSKTAQEYRERFQTSIKAISFTIKTPQLFSSGSDTNSLRQYELHHNRTTYYNPSIDSSNSEHLLSSSKDVNEIYSKFSTTTPIPETCYISSMKDAKLILLWTPFFGTWDYFPQENFQLCSHCRNCRITTDRSKLQESDALIFHARDVSLLDLPPIRYPHQRWIFYCLESPPYSDFPGLQYMRNMFNWTMTYREDSDIFVRYGAVVKNQQPKQFDLQSLQKYYANKTKSVVWMVSHCPTFGGRDEYVAELSRYIDVDIYGTCGTFVCPPRDTDKCLQEYADKYKFFLAFENTICRDYISEKSFRNLKYDIIPVVFGGADYDKFLPPNSYIDALSFQSPKHLALFLSEVGRDFKFYSNYFKWKEHYSPGIINRKECDLCTMLHKKDSKSSSYDDLRKWWVTDSHCYVWEPNNGNL